MVIAVGGEERVCLAHIGASGEVTPEVAAGTVGNVDEALLVTLAVADVELALALVVVGEGEITEFGCPNAGLDEDHDNGLIPLGGGAAVAGDLARSAVPGGVVFTGRHHRLDLGFAIFLDHRAAVLRAGDLFGDGVGDS